LELQAEYKQLQTQIFDSNLNFETKALRLFNYQYRNNSLYQKFCDLLAKEPSQVNNLLSIPFFPISFFKKHQIKTESEWTEEVIFTSSGTNGKTPSRHFIRSGSFYKAHSIRLFESMYGDLSDYTILALLPSYLEREGSSLIYMVQAFIEKAGNAESGFFLNDIDHLSSQLQKILGEGKKVLLFGVSFALLNLPKLKLRNNDRLVVVETGGMKGRQKEITRTELHQAIGENLSVKNIHSEYGMTELLSQAWSKADGIFKENEAMKILLRAVNDPFDYVKTGRVGVINVVDLANIHSIGFIATDDLGRAIGQNKFEVLGRLDGSDLRGCNLLIGE